MSNKHDGLRTLQKLAGIADLLDQAGMFEDACAVDSLLEAAALDPGILKEAGIWESLMGKLSGGARRVLNREYRASYRHAREAQKQLQDRLSELAAKVKDMGKQIWRHDLKAWRNEMMALPLAQDLPAFQQFEQSLPDLIRAIYNEARKPEGKPGEKPEEKPGEGGVPGVIPPEHFTGEPSAAPGAPGAPAGPPPAAPPAPAAPAPAPAPPASAPAAPEPAPPAEEEEPALPEEQIEQMEESLSDTEKEAIEPEEPEPASPAEEAKSDSTRWTPATFRGRSRTSIPIEVDLSPDHSMMRMKMEDYPRFVMGSGTLSLPHSDAKAIGQGRPLRDLSLTRQTAGESFEQSVVIPNWGTAPIDLIEFMGPYYWDSKKSADGEHILFVRTNRPLDEMQMMAREQARTKANISNIERARRGSALRMEAIRKIAEESMMAGEMDEADIEAIDEAARAFLGEEQ